MALRLGSCQARLGHFILIKGLIETIDPELRLKHYGTIKTIGRDYMVRPPQLDGVCGIWVYGKSGSGKTTNVNRAYPNAYLKPLNKWWDGYQGEEVVILDDMDIYHRDLTSNLKHWGDFLPFIGEVKMQSTFIRPKKFIVTSQYTIREIWKDDEESFEALNRRFTSVEKVSGQDLILL